MAFAPCEDGVAAPEAESTPSERELPGQRWGAHIA